MPLGITRGYSSETFTWHTARTIRQKIRDGKQCWIYQMGDHDPSGVDGWRAFRSRVTDFLIDWGITPEDHVTFKRLAVTPAQIETLGLPTRPTKPSDSRSAGFVGESVEVDAIPANRLRAIVKNAILRHIDSRALELQRSAEESERELLTDIRSLVA